MINVPNLEYIERQIVPVRCGNEISLSINYYKILEFDWIAASPIWA